jgi:hypothetical protein
MTIIHAVKRLPQLAGTAVAKRLRTMPVALLREWRWTG